MNLSTSPFALEFKGHHPVVLESFLLCKFVELLRTEQGSVVALNSLRSSISGKDLFQSLLVGLEDDRWYRLYHWVSGSLVKQHKIVVSIWVWSTMVYL